MKTPSKPSGMTNNPSWLISSTECERKMYTTSLRDMDGVISERHAVELMHSIRWIDPMSIDCPRCGKRSCLHLKLGDGRMKCSACKSKFTFTTGTFIHSTKLSCAIWYRFCYLVCVKKMFSTTYLSRDLGISVNTASYMLKSLTCAVKHYGIAVSSMSQKLNDTQKGLHLLLKMNTSPIRKQAHE